MTPIMELRELTKFFLTGLVLGNGPCLYSCIPLVFPYLVGKGSDWKSGLRFTLVFSLSRIIPYSILGALCVVIYKSLNIILNQYAFYLKYLTGLVVLVIGVLYIIRNESKACKTFNKYLKSDTKFNAFVFGLLIGFAPCVPLIGIITYIAATAANPLHGFIYGFCFGIGTTISVMIPLGMLAGQVSKRFQGNARVFLIVRIISGLVLISYGLSLFFR